MLGKTRANENAECGVKIKTRRKLEWRIRSLLVWPKSGICEHSWQKKIPVCRVWMTEMLVWNRQLEGLAPFSCFQSGEQGEFDPHSPSLWAWTWGFGILLCMASCHWCQPMHGHWPAHSLQRTKILFHLLNSLYNLYIIIVLYLVFLDCLSVI